jgi:hypothetical protein
MCVYVLYLSLQPDYYRDAPHFRRVGDGPQYRLEIPRAKLDFTGAYSVIARNCHGEAKAVISLQIYAKGKALKVSVSTADHVIPESLEPVSVMQCSHIVIGVDTHAVTNSIVTGPCF